MQYLAHSYRQIGNESQFTKQIELILRGTLGFQTLRRSNIGWANQLVQAVQVYGGRIAGHPLQLVDSTGFSWESVSRTLGKLADERITEDVWDPRDLFRENNKDLPKLMGILLEVAELRKNLTAATGGSSPDGDKLARIIKDWVNGMTLPNLATTYFNQNTQGQTIDATKALTSCCQSVFGKLAQTASWGLAALQTLTFRERFDSLSPSEQQTLRNLPARVYYGVGTDEAIALRLLGVPRQAASPLARYMIGSFQDQPLSQLRQTLIETNGQTWTHAIGALGNDYFAVWRILEGLH